MVIPGTAYTDPSRPPQPYGFNGNEALKGDHLPATLSLMDFNARLYSPALGIFLAVDPKATVLSGLSPYNFGLNNPAIFSDPNGEMPFLAVLAAIGKLAIKGAAITGLSYTAQIAMSDGGFSNWNWGHFGRAVGMGAVSGIVTGGIGNAFGPVGSRGIGGEIGRALAHGQANMMIGAAFGQTPSLSGFVVGGLSSLSGSALHKAGTFAQVVGSSLVGGIGVAELSGGNFWKGVATSATIAGLNHLAHAGIEGLRDRALIRKIRKKGFSPINLSKNPYKRVVEGFKIARLYNRGKLPELRKQYPNGMRITDLFDMSSVENSPQWSDKRGGYVGSIYYHKTKAGTIRLDSKSFYIGDVETRIPYKITLYDNPSNWTPHQISWIHYYNDSYSHWLSAIQYINRY